MKNNPLTFHQLDWLEKFAIGVFFWALFFPKPYELVMGILLLLPILGIIINGFQKPSIVSLVEIPKNDKGKHDVADFIDLPAIAICIRVLLDFEFDNLYSLVVPGTIGFVLMLLILFLTHRLIDHSVKDKWWIYTMLIFNVFLYSYGATYAINCTYDFSEPKIYSTEIIDKNTSRGRRGRISYYIKVAPWGHHYDKEKIRVSAEQYKTMQIGDNAEIALRKGVFNIPWYNVK